MEAIAKRTFADVIVNGRPPTRPRARAEARPATVRSEISFRSNSAKAAKIPSTSFLPRLDTRRQLDISGRTRLFCTVAGTPLSDNYVRRLAARADLSKRVHPHGLRHTFVVELEAAGTPATTISKLLGHST